MSSSYSSSVARFQGNGNVIEEEAPVRLSDLVRTAETSRLRRRGAISGAHRARLSNTLTAVQAQPQSQTTQTTSRTSAPLSAPNANGGQWSAAVGSTVSAYPWATSGATPFGSSLIVPGNEADDDSGKTDDGVGDGEGYAIYCGAESPEFGTDEPYRVSPLPQPLPFTPSPFATFTSSATSLSYDSERRTMKNRTSTGCGALIHAHASPRARHGTWAARGEAGSAVVPMDKCYFSRGGQPKQFACGCRWHGVGCAKCGNALGHIYVPCQAVNSTRASNPISSSTSPSSQCHYTFYADAVSSDPDFSFPPAALARHHSHSSTNNTRGSGATGVSGLGNPDFTSSYLPVGEYAYNYGTNTNSGGTIFSPAGFYGYAEQGDAEGENEQDFDSEPDFDSNSRRREREGGFDANGMPIGIGNENEDFEPGSPDKPPADSMGTNGTSNSGRTLMLWPAR